MKARFYDPAVGRFINQDTYLGESTTPPSLHRYLYAYSNPTVYIDPDGNAALLASGAEFDEFGYQLYRDGKYIQAGGVAVASAFYRVGTGFFTLGLFDEANDAITTTDTYGAATKQFGNSVANTAKEVAQEYATEGAVTATATVASKVACGRWKQACGTVVDTAKKIGDKLNTDIKITKESPSGPNAATDNTRALGDQPGGADAELGNITDQQMIDTIVDTRAKNNVSGSSTLSMGRDGDGLITPVRQDIKSPDGNPANNVHAEPQTLRDLSDRRGNHTIAVDQAPCGADKHNCAAAIKNTGNTRVIVPEDINKADRKTKSAAVKAAEGKTSVRAKEVNL